MPNYKHPLSKISKITDIADEFGYYQKGVKVLANTIFSTKTNSQGLKFNIDYKRELLFETSTLDNNCFNSMIRFNSASRRFLRNG